MIHPLAEDYDQLKDHELESRISDLSNKYFQTQNEYVKHQLATFIDIYKTELNTRRAKELQNAYKKREMDLDNLINVK